MCTSSPAITRTRGARCRPCVSTFQPARRRTSCRAAARHVKFAMWQPVTKPTPALRGRSEQLENPAGDDVFDHRHGRRHHIEARVLIPGAAEPVGGDGHGHRAAGDEPEVARPGAGDDAGIGVSGEVVEHVDRVRRRARGSGPPSASRSAARVAVPPTWRAPTSSRNSVAMACAVSRTARCIVRSPDRDQREIAGGGPLLPFDRGLGGEDRARVVAVRQVQALRRAARGNAARAPSPRSRLRASHKCRKRDCRRRDDRPAAVRPWCSGAARSCSASYRPTTRLAPGSMHHVLDRRVRALGAEPCPQSASAASSLAGSNPARA